MTETHVGRSWTGDRLEKDCPCPKAECGLVIANMVLSNNGCEQHSGMKTLRQIHTAENCPGMKKVEQVCTSKYDFGKVVKCNQNYHTNDLHGRKIHSFNDGEVRLTWKEGEPGSTT